MDEVKSKNMTASEILEHDIKFNHARSLSIDQAIDIIQSLIDEGAIITRNGNTLFISQKLNDGVVEFHAINADRAPQFTNNIENYLRSIRKAGAKEVFATYSNPKVNSIFESLAKKMDDITVKTEKIDQDSDRVYKITINWS